jgi:hypothetical protein
LRRTSTVFIRGTKRSTRLRTVPIVGEMARSLLEYALEHAQGEGSLLFRPWTNVRRDLHAACDAVKIARCSPNDLRLHRRCNSLRGKAGIRRIRRTRWTRMLPPSSAPKIRGPARRCLTGPDVRARMTWCLGAESNHRHGDFQAWYGCGQGRGIRWRNGGGRAAL